jgi:hypothetical protein
MTTEQKIEAIKDAITRANNLQSKMDEVAWSVPALSSLRIRHLMNNLGAISNRYFESGVHVSGLFSSVIRNNPNLWSATANDNWASDETGDIKYYDQFMANTLKCICENTKLTVIKKDTFDVDPSWVVGPIDLYLFDASHDYESQRKAMTHFLPAMADEFILCVDDYDWKEVWKGTQDGLADAGVEILYEHSFVGNDHDNEGFWNGFYVALVKKK